MAFGMKIHPGLVFVAAGWAEISSEHRSLMTGTKAFRLLVPVGMCQAITMPAGIAAYMYLDIGLIQMLKAFTPVTVLVALIAVRLEVVYTPMIMSVLVICGGVALGGRCDHRCMGRVEISGPARSVAHLGERDRSRGIERSTN